MYPPAKTSKAEYPKFCFAVWQVTSGKRHWANRRSSFYWFVLTFTNTHTHLDFWVAAVENETHSHIWAVKIYTIVILLIWHLLCKQRNKHLWTAPQQLPFLVQEASNIKDLLTDKRSFLQISSASDGHLQKFGVLIYDVVLLLQWNPSPVQSKWLAL